MRDVRPRGAHGPGARRPALFIRGEKKKTAESREARGPRSGGGEPRAAARGRARVEAVQAAFDDGLVAGGERGRGEKRRRRGDDEGAAVGTLASTRRRTSTRRLESVASRNRIAALPAALERSAPRLRTRDVSENNLASGGADDDDDDDDDDDAGIAVAGGAARGARTRTLGSLGFRAPSATSRAFAS